MSHPNYQRHSDARLGYDKKGGGEKRITPPTAGDTKYSLIGKRREKDYMGGKMLHPEARKILNKDNKTE